MVWWGVCRAGCSSDWDKPELATAMQSLPRTAIKAGIQAACAGMTVIGALKWS